MPKGSRETFKVRLLLEPGQRLEWKRLQEQAGSLAEAVSVHLSRSQEALGYVAHRDFVADPMAGRRDEHGAGSLLEESALSVARAAYDAWRAREDRGAGHGRRRPLRLDLEVPVGDVVFSTSGPSVRLPYLGLTRYVPNQFITIDYGRVPEEGFGEEKVRLRSAIRSMALTAEQADVFLVVDCSSDEERERRRGARADKARRRAMRMPDVLK